MATRIRIEDRLYKSKAGFFEVWRLKNVLGIYNKNGVCIATVKAPSYYQDDDGMKRYLRMAQLCADALEAEFQY